MAFLHRVCLLQFTEEWNSLFFPQNNNTPRLASAGLSLTVNEAGGTSQIFTHWFFSSQPFLIPYILYMGWRSGCFALFVRCGKESFLWCRTQHQALTSVWSGSHSHKHTRLPLTQRVLESLLTFIFWLRGCHFRQSTTQWLITLVVCVWSSTTRNSQHHIWGIELGRWRMRVCIPVFDHLVYVLLTY